MIFGMVTTHGSAAYTPYALRSFFASTRLLQNDQFILIDNDNSLDQDWLTPLPPIEVIKNKNPISFAANLNQVLNRAGATKDDVLFLNNDLIFTKDWIEPLRADAPAILSPLSNIEVPARTERTQFLNVVSLEQYLTHTEEVEKISAAHRAKNTGFIEVLSLPFFCIKIPYIVYSRVGLLDERFGRGGAEDNDYCLRTLLCGFRVRYAASSWILHFNGRSTWGVESSEESQARCAKFTEEFRKKWGTSLCDLVIQHSFKLQQEPELARFAGSGNFKEIIRKLTARDGVESGRSNMQNPVVDPVVDPVVGSEGGKEERAVPGLTDLGNVCKHIARYNVALLRCEKKQVIDAACGSGYGSFMLAMVAAKVLAIDRSQDAINYARQNYASATIEHRVADIYTLTDECDVLVSFETVEHLDDLARYEEMMFRCLRSGGFLIYSVPLNEAAGFNPYHKQLFTYESARNAFPSLQRTEEFIQHGVNFYPPARIPLHLPWLAYIGIYQKP